jgi:hypothetical protein
MKAKETKQRGTEIRAMIATLDLHRALLDDDGLRVLDGCKRLQSWKLTETAVQRLRYYFDKTRLHRKARSE